MAYAAGDRVRVRITAAKKTKTDPYNSRYRDDMPATTQVSETEGAGAGFYHSLFLPSESVTEADGSVAAYFEATITGERIGSLTRVTATDGCNHLVYLGSPAVTPLVKDDAQIQEESEMAVRYARGDRVRVRMTVDIGESTYAESSPYLGKQMYSTTKVKETAPTASDYSDTGTRWAHFAYLGSNMVTVGEEGQTAEIEFDGRITGEINGQPINTTEVREERPDGGYGYTHFLFLPSASVTRLDEPEQAKPDEPAKIEVVPDPALLDSYKVERTGITSGADRITTGDTEVESLTVLSRIAELEAKTPSGIFAVVRRNPRAGQQRVLAEFTGFTDAVAYIEENDYDKERIGVEIRSDDDAKELGTLQRLNEAGRAVFGSSQWITDSVLLLRYDFFGEDWAREQTSEELGIAVDDTRSWPFSLVDWRLAANDRLYAGYKRVEFDGEGYWAR